jgi:hypothetical protein
MRALLLFFCFNSSFDKLEGLSTGTFYTEPIGAARFGATKDEGAVLYWVGSGPSRTDQIEK